MHDTLQPTSPPEEIGLLDILMLLSENIKLLILGPLAAGLLALGLSFLWPRTFESVAVLQAEPAIASLMTSAAVLDPISQNLGLRHDATAEQAREALRQHIKTSIGRSDKLLTLSVSGSTPVQAQAIARAVLEGAYAQSRPKGSYKARLERQLAEAEARLLTAQSAAAQLAQSLVASKGTPAAQRFQRLDALDLLTGGSAGLLDASAAAQKQIVELEELLEGVTEARLMQTPTLPEKAVSPKKGQVAVMSALGMAVLLVILVFIRGGMRRVQDTAGLAKLGRIRRSLGLNTY